MTQPPPQPPPSTPSKPSAFFAGKLRALLASLALAVGFAWVLHAGALPLWPPAGTLDEVHWPRVALMALAMLFSVVARFARYRFLLRPLAPLKVGRIVVLLSIALGLLTFLPFRLGEFARPAMLRSKGKLSAWAVAGTVGAERIIDGVVISCLLLAGLAFASPREPLPERIGSLPVPAALVPRVAGFTTLGFIAGFIVLVSFFVFRKQAHRLTVSALGWLSRPFAEKVARAVSRVSDGLSFLPQLSSTLPYLLTTVAAFAAHVWAIQLLASAVGLPTLDFAQSAVVVGVLGLSFALPNAPGFFGSVQLALYSGLAIYVEPAQVVRQGAAFVFLFYVIYLGQVIGLTLMGLLVESLTRRSPEA